MIEGTWLLKRVPVEVKSHWAQWIGSLRADQIRDANLVLVRSIASVDPTIAGDAEQHTLTQHLIKLFSMLVFDGVPEYAEADIVAGSVLDEGPMIRHMSRLKKFHPTKGYVRQPITLARLEGAVTLRQQLDDIERRVPANFSRFMRGMNILKDGLEQNVGQERLHQFVRSLEALVLPSVGATRRQFVHRCQTFATANPAAITVLDEAYNLRSDAEHIQDWSRSLTSYPASEREDIALQRTRQMERLSRFAYSRILSERGLWPHFQDDMSQDAFWRLSDGVRRTTWGVQLDLSTIPLVRNYDSWNRAA